MTDIDCQVRGRVGQKDRSRRWEGLPKHCQDLRHQTTSEDLPRLSHAIGALTLASQVMKRAISSVLRVCCVSIKVSPNFWSKDKHQELLCGGHASGILDAFIQ